MKACLVACILFFVSLSCKERPKPAIVIENKSFTDKILDRVLAENKIDEEYCFELSPEENALKLK